MLARAHIAIGVFFVVLLLPHVNYKLVFIPVILIASLLPDVDTGFSTLGSKGIFRPLQFFVKHRGLMHSFTFCAFIAAILAAFVPLMALPFFLGYGFHLLADSFTVEGIRPFWPAKAESKGIVKTGGQIETAIFIVFVIVDIVLLVSWFV